MQKRPMFSSSYRLKARCSGGQREVKMRLASKFLHTCICTQVLYGCVGLQDCVGQGFVAIVTRGLLNELQIIAFFLDQALSDSALVVVAERTLEIREKFKQALFLRVGFAFQQVELCESSGQDVLIALQLPAPLIDIQLRIEMCRLIIQESLVQVL
jgi:hypothetical protein